MNQHTDAVRHSIDMLSAAAIVSSLAGYLPPMAALLGIIWYVLQIFGWFEKRFSKKRQYKRRATDNA